MHSGEQRPDPVLGAGMQEASASEGPLAELCGLSSNGGGVLHATWAPQPGGARLV